MAPGRFRHQLPTKSDMRYNNGEPLSLSGLTVRSRRSIGIVSAVALAALSASFAAVATAVGALDILTDRTPHAPESTLLPNARKSIFSRTLRSTSFHSTVDYADVGEVVLPSSGQDTLSGESAEDKSQDTVQSSIMLPVKGNSYMYSPNEQSSVLSTKLQALPNDNLSTTSRFDEVAENQPLPMVAWLMSFPNSGTSYTIHLIREVSNTTTATNYGLEGDIKDEPSVPIHPDYENGPCLERIKTINTSIPPRFILTKTHCSGFCAECDGPASFIEAPRSFQMGCLRGIRGVWSKDGKKIQPKLVRYDASLVKRAIHVVRDPLDNIVARFHLEHKRHKKIGDDEWPKVYPNTKEGFKRWCANIDNDKSLIDARWVDKKLAAALAAAPCHAEFFRYVQWHNLAFSMARDMAVPTFVLHYESYRDHFDETLTDLLIFLELPRVKSGMAFEKGKEYKDHYTEEQRVAAATLIKELASLETWQNLQHYFKGQSMIESYSETSAM